jgi:hypothetical protein
MEFNRIHALITTDESEKALKLIQNNTRPGEDNVNSELYKQDQEAGKERLPRFLNNIHKQLFSKRKGKCHCNPIISER